MDDVCQKETFEDALQAVERKGGCPGIDGMTTSELREALPPVESLFNRLLERKYFPSPVVVREIPKGDGKFRKLAIPTVRDRLVQRMLMIELTKIADPLFSDASFGFRPGRSQIDAIRMAQNYFIEGYGFTVDIDIQAFFDNIDRGILMNQLSRYTKDERIKSIIRRFNSVGRLYKGDIRIPPIGIPQGGPLSPLLANIYLDGLDEHLEEKGFTFVRYADDLRICVRNRTEGEEALSVATQFLGKRLQLSVNPDKTRIVPVNESPFLGYLVDEEANLRVASKSIQRIKNRLREIIQTPITVNKRVELMNSVVRGWLNYFKYAQLRLVIDELDKALQEEIDNIPEKATSQYLKQGIKTFREVTADQRIERNVESQRDEWDFN